MDNGGSRLIKLLPLAVVMGLAYFTWTFFGDNGDGRPEDDMEIPELVIDGVEAGDRPSDAGLQEGMLLEPSADQ